MKIENKEFWEKSNIISTQEKLKKASDFEVYMFEESQKRYQPNEIKSIKVFGCGTGREIESIAEYFNPTEIVASDISQNMIEKCKVNLKLWKIDSITETLVGDAKEYNKVNNKFDLVTIFNSMMTYVPERKDRLSIFKNSYQILKSNGTLIGTVHNQVGSPTKTLYFKIKNLFSFFLGDKAGNRDTGFNGFKVKGYYYNKKGLINDLQESGFKSIEVLSLEEYYKLQNIYYNRKKGYNNLIFIASKP
ncbi:class I SAM-dependent methyltransferase [Flavobacterium sp. SUN052]|uniref:class I SAM-dependent methyltransferase n=1 Tax=Flavobacterium sp. SUN052 TaxID=3002441 RepID=UPI00237D4E1A|nr:class I SAM-dependent methyltransferase [Flavobacterium sp. SUN052]MEC4004390.1 class I SAM-dependent methyltransferase [Flavobacterium sp. SUN052]